eukprot:2183014-Prymnesium_polylepis.1
MAGRSLAATQAAQSINACAALIDELSADDFAALQPELQHLVGTCLRAQQQHLSRVVQPEPRETQHLSSPSSQGDSSAGDAATSVDAADTAEVGCAADTPPAVAEMAAAPGAAPATATEEEDATRSMAAAGVAEQPNAAVAAPGL